MNFTTLFHVSHSLRPLAVVFALAAALGASACTPVVTGGGGAGGATADSGSGGSPPVALYAIATPCGEVTSVSPENSLTSGVDPSSLCVQISNFSQACLPTAPAAPATDCSPGVSWDVLVAIPQDLLVQGVLQLKDPRLTSWGTAIDLDSMCSGLAHEWSAVDGSFEILSIDASTIVVKFSGTNQNPENAAIDGEYTAQICPSGGSPK